MVRAARGPDNCVPPVYSRCGWGGPLRLPVVATRHMQNTQKSLLLAFLSLCASVPALARPPQKPPTPPNAAAPLPLHVPAPLPIERFTLANGMRVVVQSDARAPLVAVGLMAQVGSRDETQGSSGLAHFFEHMMFQGSAHVGKMEHMKQIEAMGGEVNANTSTDRTYFHEVVPKPALQLALWLEADRLVALRVDQEHVDNQRQAVLEERRERIENKPYGLAHLQLDEVAFPSWTLGHSTIGEVGDLQRAPLDAFQVFWKKWYAPENIVLVLVGDVTAAEARAVAEATVGRVPRRGDVPHAAFSEPEQKQHVCARHDELLAKTPAFHLAWRVPASPHADSLALDLLAEVLGGGPSSRLDKLLTRDLPLATQYMAGTDGRRDVDLFQVYVEMAAPGLPQLEEAKRRIRTAIADIAAHGVTPAELRRAQETFVAGWVFGTQSLARKAEFLAQFELFEGDAQKANTLLARYAAVTPQDLQRVARTLLTFDREVELDVLPKGHPLPKDAGLKPSYVTKAEFELTADARKAAAEAARIEQAKVAAEAKAAAEARATAERAAAAEAKAAANARAAAEQKAAAEAKAAEQKAAAEAKAAESARIAAELKAASEAKALEAARIAADQKAAAEAKALETARIAAERKDAAAAKAKADADAAAAKRAAAEASRTAGDATRAATDQAAADAKAAADKAAMDAKAAAETRKADEKRVAAEKRAAADAQAAETKRAAAEAKKAAAEAKKAAATAKHAKATAPAKPAHAAALPVAVTPAAEPTPEVHSPEEDAAAAAAKAAMDAKAAAQARAAAEAKAAAEARAAAEAKADVERKAAALARVEAEKKAEAEARAAAEAKARAAMPAAEPKTLAPKTDGEYKVMPDAKPATPPAVKLPSSSPATDESDLAPIKRVKKSRGGSQ